MAIVSVCTPAKARPYNRRPCRAPVRTNIFFSADSPRLNVEWEGEANMADPELQGDEHVLIRTQDVHVKSISFEAILTDKRIILVDRLKNLLPPKEIPISTIQSIEPGENAIRDLTIAMGVITKSGGVRQMVLTFSREGGGNRAEERDDWIRQIRAHLTPSFEQVMRRVIPGMEPPGPAAGTRTPSAFSAETTPVRIKSATHSTEQRQSPLPQPAPAEDSILGTYCTRCGTKVPEGSGFCNKCGARITLAEEATPAPVAPAGPAYTETVARQEPPAPQNFRPAPPAPESYPPVRPAPAPSRSPAPVQPGASAPSAPYPDEKRRQNPKLFSPKDLPPTPLVPSSMPTTVHRLPKKPRNRKKIVLAVGIIVIILIVAVIGIAVIPKLGMLSTHSSGSSTPGSVTPTTTTAAPSASSAGSTTAGTAVVVATQTPANIPTTGVAVSVSYIGGFKGSYNADGNTTTIANSGSKVYEIDNATGLVSATFQKTDDTTTHALTVGIYNNGKMLVSNASSASYGSVTVSTSV